jgi:protein tyrosine phosphatase
MTLSRPSGTLTELLIKHDDEMKTQPNDYMNEEFIKQVITIAKAAFVKGSTISKSITTKMEVGTTHDSVGRNYTKDTFPCLIDADFNGFNANPIKGTGFIACVGPTQSSVEDYIKNVLLNAKYPPKNIIVLGTCLYYTNGTWGDFYDYCIVPTSQNAREYQTASIQVDDHTYDYSLTVSGHQVSFNELFKTKITASHSKKNSKINVTLIPLSDNKTFILSAKNDETKKVPCYEKQPPTREQMWQLFKETCSGLTVVHCSAGIGRTGHLILTFEILKNYFNIFNSDNAGVCANNIMKLLKQIRYNRPCLVNTDEQFTQSIENAISLHSYALEKGYNLQPYIRAATQDTEQEDEVKKLTDPEASPRDAFNKIFAHLAINQHNRQAALVIFKEQLELTTSPIEIQNLLSAAKPYINVHRNSWDSFFHLENTNTWKKMIKLGRTRALAMLPLMIGRDSSETVADFLETACKLSVFSQHRNNSVFFGAFGRTNAQRTIEKMITELRARR